MRALLVVMVLVALVLVSSGAAVPLAHSRFERASADHYAITASGVGGFAVRGATYAKAVRYFAGSGLRLTPSFGLNTCALTSKARGLQLIFVSFAGSRGTHTTCTLFFAATVSDPAWHTRNGLRVSDPLVLLRHLFPAAADGAELVGPQFGVPNWSAWWWLTRPPRNGGGTIVTAYVTHGHVAALGLDLVGH